MHIKTKGIVLKREIFKEASKLLTMYTLEFGKIKAIAVGSKKINAKLLFATEPLVESNFMFLSNKIRNFNKIIGGNILNTFYNLRNDFKKYFHACKILETVNSLTAEHSKNEKKYYLIIRTLNLLEKVNNPDLIYYAFLFRFLKLCGYELVFDQKFYYNDICLNLSGLSSDKIDKLNLSDKVKKEIDTYCKKLLLNIVEKPLNTWKVNL